MKVCVYGAGAIGGHLAGRLAKGGAAVSVIARGSTLAALRANGIKVKTPRGEIAGRVEVTEDPNTLGVQDAVVVAVKAPALPSMPVWERLRLAPLAVRLLLSCPVPRRRSPRVAFGVLR